MVSRRELILLAVLALALGVLGWRTFARSTPPPPLTALPPQDGETARLLDHARQRYRDGDHFGSLDALAAASRHAPDDPQVLAFQALVMRDSRGPVPTLPLFERALKAAPDNLDLLGEYASTLAEAGRNREVLAVARRMVAVDPRDPRAYFLQAVLAARGGRDELARRLLWKTRDAYRQMPAALLLTGVIEARSGNTRQAIEALTTLAALQPDNQTVQLLLGRTLLVNGDPGGAVDLLRPLADRREASPYLLALVGQALEQDGKRAEAAAYIDRARRAPADQLGVLPVSADGQLAVWRARDNPLEPRAAIARIRELIEAENKLPALGLAQQLAWRFPGSADVARVMGDARLLAGDNAGALDSYRQVARVRRDFSLVERMMAALRRTGRTGEAKTLLESYRADNPRDARAARLLGEMALAAGDAAGAAKLLGLASRQGEGSDPLLLSDLALARLGSGDTQGALDPARRAQGLQRANPEVAATLARVLEAEGRRPSEAQVLLDKARQLAE